MNRTHSEIGALSRRTLLQAGGVGTLAAIAGRPSTFAASQSTPATGTTPLKRTFPSTGATVPAVGLGTFMVFDSLPGVATDTLTEVVARFWDHGGRLTDTSALYGSGEVNLGTALAATDVPDDAFFANKLWTTGSWLWDEREPLASLERSIERLARPIDLLQVHSLVNVEVAVPIMRAWKAEGRISAIGVTHHEPQYYDALTRWVASGVVDAVQVHYSIQHRDAEASVLRAATDNGVAVLTNMPLEKGRLHALVGDTPLPAIAAELGIETWAQFFLKWVIGNPAVTCAICGTSNPDHVIENLGAMYGPIPDEDARASMVAYMETIPGFADLQAMPWYPDRIYPGLISTSRAAIEARIPDDR